MEILIQNWNYRHERLELPLDVIHLWIVEPDNLDLSQRSLAILSQDERDRLNRYVHPKVRDQFWSTRHILRSLFSHYLQIPAQAIPIQYAPGGKPYLAAPYTEWQFNVSHTDSLIAIAVTQHRQIGIDVEQLRPMPHYQDLIERFFAADEIALFQTIPLEIRPRRFFHSWVCKEAVLKTLGQGIHALDSCEIAFREDGSPMISRVQEDREPMNRFGLWLQEWREKYPIALVWDQLGSGSLPIGLSHSKSSPLASTHP